MTVQRIYAPEVLPFTGPGDYAFDFDAINEDVIEVWGIDGEGNRTQLDLNKYFVTLEGNRPIFTGGTVTVTEDPVITFVEISIERNTKITQQVDFQPYGPFPANIVEFALDKLTMIAQELDVRKCNCAGEESFWTPS